MHHCAAEEKTRSVSEANPGGRNSNKKHSLNSLLHSFQLLVVLEEDQGVNISISDVSNVASRQASFQQVGLRLLDEQGKS